MTAKDESSHVARGWVGPLLLFGVIAALAVIGSVMIYRDQEQQLDDAARTNIEAIGGLKATEVARWRANRLADAEVFHDNPAFARLARRVHDDPDDAQAARDLSDWLVGLQVNSAYEGVYLLDSEGTLTDFANGQVGLDGTHLAEVAEASASSDEPVFLDLHLDEGVGLIHLSLVVPLVDESSPDLHVGTLVLFIDPDTYLYPYLAEWPVPSDSGETLLVRQEGNDALFLNDLRFREDAALRLRVPVSGSTPAARAARGEIGTIEAPDYRGVTVLAYITAVPDSPWFVVSKVDATEAYALQRDRLLAIVLGACTLILGAAGLSATVWRHQRSRYYRAQLEAERARAWLQDIIERSVNEVYVFDPETLRFSFVNAGAVRNLGHTPEELHEMTPVDIKPEYTEERFREVLAPMLSGDRTHTTIETLHRRKDGSTYPVEIDIDAVDSDSGPVFLAIANDISARKSAEQALADSEERFRAVFEQSGKGITMVKPDGTVVLYNDAMERLSGYSFADVNTHGWFDLVYPDEDMRANALALAQEANDGGVPYVEIPIIRKDGQERWISFATAPVHVAGELYSLSILTDITDRVTAEQRVRESEERFRLIAESMPGVIYVCRNDPDWTMLYLNPQFEELTGVPAGELLDGRIAFASLCHPEDLSGLQAEIDRSLAEGRHYHLVYRIIRPDGEMRWVEDFGGHLSIGEESNLLEGLIFDITARKRAEEELELHRKHLEELVAVRTKQLADANEELEEASRAKNHFLASMSHELRTPLNSVIGFSGILMGGLAGPLNTEQNNQITMINASGQHLLALINDVLDLAKVEAGKVTVALEEFDVADVADEVVLALGPDSSAKSLAVNLARPDMPVHVFSDCGKVRQILLNLVGNAVKFTETGHIDVTVSVRDDGAASISVADTGPGISPEDMSRIFEAFQQIETPDAAKPKGTGLGLALCREYARLLGAEISAESVVGKGSTFTLVLPFTQNA